MMWCAKAASFRTAWHVTGPWADFQPTPLQFSVFLENGKRKVASLTRCRPVQVNNSKRTAYLDAGNLNATTSLLSTTFVLLFACDTIR